MTLNRIARWLASGLAAGAAWLAFSAPAQAIPLFARQTGHNCQACHMSFPELTAYGREFKLNGYTFGEAQPIPLAVALMAEYDTISNNEVHDGPGVPTTVNCTACNHATMIQYSIFFGGRITDNFGLFGQGTGGEFPVSSGANGETGGTFTLTADNTDIRYVHRFATESSLEPDVVVGLDINNNLMVEDVWMTGPAWRYPNGGGGIAYSFNASSTSTATYGLGPVTALYIDNTGTTPGNGGPQKEVGVGVYAWWHKTIYAELSLYRSPWGFFSWMAWGSGGNQASQDAPAGAPGTLLANYNPYARLVYERDWGYHSLSVGFFGIDAKTYNCSPFDQACNTSTNTFKDGAIDAQYQYNKGQPWIFSAQTSFEHETNNFSANATGPAAYVLPMSSTSHTLNEFNINGRAYYDRMYGVNVGYSMIKGSSDALLYGANGSAPGASNTGSPFSTWWTIELNYLPVQNMRFTLQFVAYTKINGGSSNYDGLGNDASGQNHLTAAIWWAF